MRFAQHKRTDSAKEKLIPKVAEHEGKVLENLTYEEARGLEQIIFDKYGGLTKNGVKLLLNKINPIRNGAQIYEDILVGKAVKGKGATYLKAALKYLGKLI